MRKFYFKRFAAMAFMVSVFGIGTVIAQTYSGGTGTSADPFKIRTADDLMELAATKAQWAGDTLHWILTQDIDMTGKAFTPIGEKGDPFMGHVDGQSKIVSNLTVTGAASPVGMFGLVEGGTIKNLGLEDIDVTTTVDTVGGIIGHLVMGSLMNSYVETGVVVGDTCVGALVGTISDTSMVKNCLANVVVTADSTGGGLVGNLPVDDTNNVAMCVNYGTVNSGYAIADTTGIVTYANYFLDTTSALGDQDTLNFQIDSAMAIEDTTYKELDFNVWTMKAKDDIIMLKSFKYPPSDQTISTKGWKAHIAPDPDFGDIGDAIDGDNGDSYVSNVDSVHASRKFMLDVEMGRTAEITHITYVPPQSNVVPDGVVRGYQIFVTTDTATWGTAVAQGVFAYPDTVRKGDSTLANADAYKEHMVVKLPSMMIGSWVRLVADSCVTDLTQFRIGELIITGRNTHNEVPTADAGAQTNLNCIPNPGDIITLAGSGDDLDDDELTFAWIAPAGVEIDDSTKADATWAADSSAASGTYLFQLIVSDDSSSSAPDTVIYTVNVNTPPVIEKTSAHQNVAHSEWVPLTVWASDVDCHDISYTWTGPAGISITNATGTIEGEGSGTARFKAPRVDADTDLTFTVVIEDAYGDAVPAGTSTVKVLYTNTAPVADAGPPQEFEEHTVDTVWLDASASEDIDGDTIGYVWTAPAGVTLSDSSAIKPYFVVTGLDVEEDSVITISLVVSDGKLSSEPAMVNITILRDNTAISSLEAIEVSVYPNPSDGQFKVVSPSALDVYVMDILGRTLITDHFDGGMNTIDLSSFGQGLYILTVREGNNVSSMKLRVK